MKKTFFALALLFLISACKNDATEVKINYTNLSDVVERESNFNFSFDETLVPDSMIGYWQNIEYISFDPVIPGEFKWVSNSELIFSPTHRLAPATNYTAVITNKVLQYTKGKKLNIEKLSFQTKALSMNSVKAFWTKNDQQKDIVKIELIFSEDIDPTEVEKKIEIEQEGKELKREQISSEYKNIVTYYLPNINKSDEDIVIDVQLQKGLKPIGGNIAINEPTLKHALLNSPYSLAIKNVNIEHDGDKGIVKVVCTQKVNKKDIKKFISLSPEIEYEVEQNEDGFTITSSKFNASQKYTLVLKEGLKGDVGGKLKSSYSRDITFGQLKPEIRFEKDRAFYLSAKGNKNIEAKIINVDQIHVVISKVFENNLVASRNSNPWFNTSTDYYDYYYDDYYYDDYYYYNSSSEADKDIVFEKTYNANDFPKIGSSSLFKLDFTDKLKDFEGIYHVDIRSTDDRWLRDSRFVSVSDLGMIVKKGNESISVFVNSLSSTQSLANVKIKVYGKNNQLAGEATTDSDGYVKIVPSNQDVSGFSPSLITASLQNDFNVITLRDTKVNMADFELGGYRNSSNGLQAFIYPERDLYRPGETVHFAAIVRDNQWQSPGKLPIKVEVRTPNGKILSEMRKTLNNEASFQAEFKTEQSSPTGDYRINLYTSNGVYIASKTIQLQEFIPDRIKVSTQFNKDKFEVGEEADLKIKAQNLFGTPAANRNYEVEVNYRRVYLSPKGLENYDFYISNVDDDFSSEQSEGTTDENGLAQELIEIPEDFENMGKLNAVVYTTVFDETNRPVNNRKVLDISTQEAYFGIGYFDYYVGTNTLLNIPLVAIDKNEKLLSGVKAKLVIIKHEYKTILSKDGSYYTYNSQPYERIMVEKEINLNRKQNFSFNPKLSGDYEIRIAPIDEPSAYVSKYFYAYTWGNTSTTSFEVNNEGKVDIQFNKDQYEVGENATVLFKTPFDGKILVTVENDEVLQYFYLNTQNRTAEFSFLTTTELLPNAYISATLFKKHKQTDFPLTVAHGYKSLKVKEDSRKLNIDIAAVEKSRSHTLQTIKVKTKPNTKLTIAVVDEGILQVSRFKTPNPYNFFYQNRALGVYSYDLYPYLFKEISADNAGAGDQGFDLSKRVNPMQNERVKLVSFWSGIVETNNSGEASFDVDIPQFSGSLRIMAVAHKGNAFGSSQTNMLVADPIVMSSSIPRFFSPGDTALITTTLMNTTEKTANSKASILCTGPLQVISQSNQSTTINPKGEKRVSFKVYVKKEIGQAKIKINCNALGENFKEETDITIRPASSLIKETGSGSIAAGNTKTIDLNKENFIKSSVDYKVVISKNPMIEFGKDLDYLVRYPYGCSEQTISAVFPQIYFNDIAKALYKNDKNASNINNNIQVAITKLKMRQIYNGGILMWDSGSKESWWISAYAAHFLIEAKKAGYNIDQSFIDKILEYLKNRLKSKETVDYYYSRGKTKPIAPKEVAYSLYVLALAGKSDISLMNYYKSKTELLTKDSEYLLAAAYALSGDKVKAKEMLPSTYNALNSDPQFGGSFYSPLRDEAMALNALLEIEPNSPQIGVMSLHLSTNLKNMSYINTQERIFSLLALGKIARKSNKSVLTVAINSGSKKIANYTQGFSSFSTKDIKDGKIKLDVKGIGNLYYFFETEGISSDGKFKEEDSYISIRKSFYDRNGNQIYKNQFKVNDLIVIKLSLRSQYDRKRIENIAITDMLPACFEIENPKTDEIPGTEWIKKQTSPDFIDIRDDRINLFDDLYTYNNSTQDYYYVVRVVSKGTYHMGPVGADAMYNGEYHSYSGGGIIYVR